MANANVVLGNDGVNDLSGGAGRDLIYGFDPNGAQGNVGSITATRVVNWADQRALCHRSSG